MDTGPVHRRMVCLFTPSLTGTKLYCLVTEANVCEQLAQGNTRQCTGWDLTHDLKSQVQCPYLYDTEPQESVVKVMLKSVLKN